MSIMPCYPDKRAIENELGGKWEKVETITVNGADVYTYDEDIDGLPLNLNGFMLYFNVSTNQNIRLNVQNEIGASLLAKPGFLTSSSNRGIVKIISKNGYNHIEACGSASPSDYLATTTLTAVSYELKEFVRDYLSFALSGTDNTTLSLTGTIDVYFLRGV